MRLQKSAVFSATLESSLSLVDSSRQQQHGACWARSTRTAAPTLPSQRSFSLLCSKQASTGLNYFDTRLLQSGLLLHLLALPLLLLLPSLHNDARQYIQCASLCSLSFIIYHEIKGTGGDILSFKMFPLYLLFQDNATKLRESKENTLYYYGIYSSLLSSLA